MNILVPGIAVVLSSVMVSACSSPSMSPDDKLAQIFADYAGQDSPGAAVLVIQNGEKVLTGTYGLANLESHEPVQSSSNFRLASVTKQFTAMSILMLVDRGQIRLEDSLFEIMPGFPDFAKGITVTHLLQHTSGLLAYEDSISADSPTQVTDREVVEILMTTDHTYFPPGTEYRYSNSGYAVLAMIVEKYSGQSFANFLKQNIFDPLGMHNSVAFQHGVSTVPTRAYGYSVTDSGTVNTDQSPWSAVLGDGGIYSSLDDLYKWDQALYTDQLIPTELLARAFEPNLEMYGFGWRIDTYRARTRYRHSGSTSGFRNFIQRFPDERFTVIILTNRAEPEVMSLGEAVADLFLD